MAIKPTFSVSSLEGSTKLQEQLTRLRDYISLLRQEAQYLGNGKSGEQADKLQEIADSSDLEKITEALLTIEKQSVKVGDSTVANNTEISSGQVVTISKGYYDSDTILTVQGLADSSAVTNAPNADDVVAGKDYWANGVHTTGTLTDNSGKTVTVTSTTAGTAKEGDTITVTVPKAKYDESSVVDTGITVHTTYSYDAEVSVSKDEEGVEHAKVKAFDIPAGYYAQPIAIYPVFTDAGAYESVINVKDLEVHHSGVYDPHNDKTASGNGYDYYSSVSVAQAALASSATLNIATAVATINVKTQGFTDSDSYTVTLPTSIAPNAVDSAINAETPNVTVVPATTTAQTVTIPAGLYTTDTIVKVSSMSEGTVVHDDNINIKTTPALNADGSGYTVTVNVDKSGYIAAGDYVTSDLSKSSVSVTNVADTTITANTVRISTNEGYTKGEVKNLTVQEAAFNKTPITVTKGVITITPETSGWFEGKEFNVQGNVNTIVDALADTSDAQFTYNDVKDLENGKNTTKYPGGEGIYYRKSTTDLTSLVTELQSL